MGKGLWHRIYDKESSKSVGSETFFHFSMKEKGKSEHWTEELFFHEEFDSFFLIVDGGPFFDIPDMYFDGLEFRHVETIDSDGKTVKLIPLDLDEAKNWAEKNLANIINYYDDVYIPFFSRQKEESI